jgi:hypothetical protein
VSIPGLEQLRRKPQELGKLLAVAEQSRFRGIDLRDVTQ